MTPGRIGRPEDVAAEASALLEDARERALALFAAPGGDDPEALGALFRAVHSLKGLSGLAGLTHAARVSHAVEDLLDALRNGTVDLQPEVPELLERGLDEIERLVAAASNRGAGAAPPAGLLAALAKAAEPTNAPESEPLAPIPADLRAMLSSREIHRVNANVRRGRTVVIAALERTIDAFEADLKALMAAAATDGELIGTFPGTASSPDRLAFRLLAATSGPDGLSRLRAAGADGVETLLAPRLAEPKPGTAPDTLAATLRVDPGRVSALLEAVSEVDVARLALRVAFRRLAPGARDREGVLEAEAALARLDRAGGRLATSALGLRLVPVESLGFRLRRAALPLARRLGKEIAFEIEGGAGVEADKALLDELQDPLLHLVRNAVDHGVESPDARLAAGKARAGRVVFAVRPLGRRIEISISDDGRGMEAKALVSRARALGLLAAGDRAPDDPLELLFRPGFSTAAEVSEVSGRGVGLDVVKSRVEALKGVLDVTTEPGTGTTFRIVVPETLALLPTLLVRAAGHAFALEASSLLLTLPPPGDGTTEGVPLLDPDGDGTLPVVRLETVLGLPRDPLLARDAVVIAEGAGRRLGFRVASVDGLRDLLIKALPAEIPRAAEISGAAELPGGELALVLDTDRLLAKARQVAA